MKTDGKPAHGPKATWYTTWSRSSSSPGRPVLKAFAEMSSNGLGFRSKAQTGSYAVARGPTSPGIAGRRTATGMTPTTGTTTTGSGLSAFQLTGPGGCRPANADNDPEILREIETLVEVIQQTPNVQKKLGKYNLSIKNSKIGVIGDHVTIAGGIRIQ